MGIDMFCVLSVMNGAQDIKEPKSRIGLLGFIVE